MRPQEAEIEARYEKLRELGVAVDYAGRDFDNFDLRDFLGRCLSKLEFSDSRPRLLEYGTGTGPGACFLAGRGFRVDAIDRSATAIDMARRFAQERHLVVNYEVADIGSFNAPSGLYDLVIDSYCLHRIITDADRHRALTNVRRLLKSRGYFIVGSVVFSPDRNYGEDWFDSQTGIVYRHAADSAEGADTVRIKGRSWYAHHRHVTIDHLRGELKAAGFAILDHATNRGQFLCQAMV